MGEGRTNRYKGRVPKQGDASSNKKKGYNLNQASKEKNVRGLRERPNGERDEPLTKGGKRLAAISIFTRYLGEGWSYFLRVARSGLREGDQGANPFWVFEKIQVPEPRKKEMLCVRGRDLEEKKQIKKYS